MKLPSHHSLPNQNQFHRMVCVLVIFDTQPQQIGTVDRSFKWRCSGSGNVRNDLLLDCSIL